MLHVRPRRGAVATVGGSCFVADLLKPFVVGEEQLKKTWRFVLRWRGVVEEDSEIRSSLEGAQFVVASGLPSSLTSVAALLNVASHFCRCVVVVVPPEVADEDQDRDEG
nr:hypothetical protein Iba_chr04eCG20180 [Ipomoea batatas]GME04504.1 hypothetical protein Iba_scaffold2112CG0020 [Ipomoea batatas]